MKKYDYEKINDYRYIFVRNKWTIKKIFVTRKNINGYYRRQTNGNISYLNWNHVPGASPLFKTKEEAFSYALDKIRFVDESYTVKTI